MLDLLPPPYTVAPDSVVAGLLNVVALEMDALQEDLDLYQRSHWIGTVFRLREAEKIGALLGIRRLDWEDLPAYRERLLALIVSLRQGAIGPSEIRGFVFDYLSNIQRVLDSTYVPGLEFCPDAGAAYAPLAGHPRFRPLAVVENPHRMRTSGTLQANNGRVAYLFRWKERNLGLDDTVAEFQVSGAITRTPVPILLNVTTGQLIGYKGRLRFGETLEIRQQKPGVSNLAAATLDGRDVTAALFSVQGFHMGDSLSAGKADPKPSLPSLARGTNEWIFLAIGIYDIPGLDRFFFAMPDDQLREGAFDETRFDHSLFPSGTAAQLRMTWMETEPASFEVRVPRYIVVAPDDAGSRHEQVADALRGSIGRLHAAGVRAVVTFEPFIEEQRQETRFRVGIITLDPEDGPAGEGDRFVLGGRFGDSALGGSRFE